MKTLLIRARQETPEESLDIVDRAGLEGTMLDLLSRWSDGEPAPPKPCHIEKTVVHDLAGNTIGFNYYLVSEEPMILGPLKVETESESEGLSAMDAAAIRQEAAMTHDPYAGFDPESPDFIGIMTELLLRNVYDVVRDQSAARKKSFMMEPFADIPAKLHPEHIENEIMNKIVQRLQAKQYEGVLWDRRDGRVVLQARW